MIATLNTSELDPAVRTALDALAAAWSRHGGRPDAIVAAARFAIESHATQTRLSGELYASHPISVAAIVASWGFDEISVAAACCHDVVEDCGISLEDLATRIGEEAARIVDGVTKVGKIHLTPDESVSNASMSKFLAAVVDDVRVLAVKLADRLHNLRTVSHLPPEKAKRAAKEALEVFAPLAHRLGLEDPRRELEDLAFAVLHPASFERITAELGTSETARRETELKVVRSAAKLLASAGIKAEIESRTKHVYSIYKKQITTGVDVANMHDLIGIRIILPDRDSCYSVLGVVHAAMTPVPGRFKDYIAIPRPTGYQSLHTTVVFDGAEVEIQIRSETMHVQARYGVAAHFLYKDKSSRKKRPALTPTAQDSELVSALAAATSPEDFLEKLRLDLAPEEEVVVLTPKGRPIVLSADATVLDFAYKIHTDVGHRCTGARINGLLVPIRSTLRTGDVVEVITGSKPAPKPDWLNVVKTARAREKIRKFLDQATNDPVSEGRTQLLDELRARNAAHRIEDQVFLARLATTNGFNSTPDMLKALASGTRPASTLMGLPSKQATKVSRKTTPTSSFESAVADALDGLPFSLPRCCRASNLESSTGLISRLHDVSVHESSCASLASTVKDLPPGDIYRLIPLLRGDYVSWLEVHAEDRTGLLRDVSACLAEAEADIAWSSTTTTDIAILRFRLSSRLPDRAQLRSSLASLAGVVEVYAV